MFWFGLIRQALASPAATPPRTQFAWAEPMAISAYTGDWPETWGWLAFLATVLWVIAYDTLYAMADREEDLLLIFQR